MLESILMDLLGWNLGFLSCIKFYIKVKCCIDHWCDLSLSIVCSSEPHNLRRILEYLNVSRGGQQICWNGWKAGSVSCWGLCLVWRKRGAILFLSTASWGGEVERGGPDPFCLVSSNRKCGSGLKLHQERFRPNT